MRILAIPLLLAAAAPAADAGGIDFDFRIGGRNAHVRVTHRGHDRRAEHRRHEHRHVHVCDASCRKWVPGHYDEVHREVVIPAHVERRWIEPVYAVRYDECGHAHRVLVKPGCWEEVYVPARTEIRCEKLWVPGHFETVCAESRVVHGSYVRRHP